MGGRHFKLNFIYKLLHILLFTVNDQMRTQIQTRDKKLRDSTKENLLHKSNDCKQILSIKSQYTNII